MCKKKKKEKENGNGNAMMCSNAGCGNHRIHQCAHAGEMKKKCAFMFGPSAQEKV
jgi:hypothetical protein